jgi:hypothetical protein
MKKLIYIMLFLPLIALGQTLNEDKTSYTEVVEVDATKAEIQQQLVGAIAVMYKSAQDVIQLNTEDKIIAKGNFEFNMRITKTQVTPYRINNTLTLGIKDEKYRIQLNPNSMSYQGTEIQKIYPIFMTDDILPKQEWYKMSVKMTQEGLMRVGQSKEKAEKRAVNYASKEGIYEIYVENKKEWDRLIVNMFSAVKTNATEPEEDDW